MTTTAFAVSTSHSGSFTSTCPPSWTRQVTNCASVKPSPRSGRRKVWSAIGEGDVDGFENPIDIRKVELLVARRRIRRIHSTDAGHRGLQQVEAVVADPGGDFTAKPTEDRRLVNHDRAMRLLQRRQDGWHVEGGEAAQVDDLERDVLLFGSRGRIQREADGRPIGDDRGTGSFARHPGAADPHLELGVDLL